MTFRKLHDRLTEVHQVIGDQVKVTRCRCTSPGASREGCSTAGGNKTPCRCACHSRRQAKSAPGAAHWKTALAVAILKGE
jgi:hypothetical protein